MSYPPPQNGAKERKNMNVRNDSAFAKLDEEDKDMLLEEATESSLDDLVEWVAFEFEIDTTRSSLHRYMQRLKKERIVEDAKADEESLVELAELGKSSKAREAALELARRKLVDVAQATSEPEKLEGLVKTLSEEKAREHELAMRERAMKVAEENAKLGWRKLELQQARSALRLLPAILQVVTGGDGTAEERLGKVRELLMSGGGKLLVERTAD